jgi:hypothetical protein
MAILHDSLVLTSLHLLYPSLHRTFQTFFLVPFHFSRTHSHFPPLIPLISMGSPIVQCDFSICFLLPAVHFCRHFWLTAVPGASGAV